jgi:hypothetical protein
MEMRHAIDVVGRVARSPLACFGRGRIVGVGGRVSCCGGRSWQRLKVDEITHALGYVRYSRDDLSDLVLGVLQR